MQRPDASTDTPPNPDASVTMDTPDAGATPNVRQCMKSFDAGDCILRVDGTGGTTDGTGDSWASALGDLQTALDLADCGCEIWLAEGTYLPTRPIDVVGGSGRPGDQRRKSFLLAPGVRVLGGFAGTELTAEERDPALHETVLSGDLGEVGNDEDNAYHVVIALADAALDGLTIRDGQGDGFDNGQGVGGGLIAVGADISVIRVRFLSNVGGHGGAFFNDSSSTPRITACEFSNNRAEVGGALSVGTEGTVEIIDTAFSGNVAPFSGGAIHHSGADLHVVGSYFTANRSDFGAAIHAAGGNVRAEATWFEANVSTAFGGSILSRLGAEVLVSNCMIAYNTAIGHGGALAAWGGTIHVQSTTIAGNYAAFGGGFLVKDGADVELVDTVVWNNVDDEGRVVLLEGENNVYTATNSDVPTDTPGSDNFEADPLFANVPLLTRFTNRAETEGVANVANADVTFAVGDQIEVGDDGVLRTVTNVTSTTMAFDPPLADVTARFLRIDKWPQGATDLEMDLHPTAASPLLDRASASAPPRDVQGSARVDVPNVGNACEAPPAACNAADLGALEYTP